MKSINKLLGGKMKNKIILTFIILSLLCPMVIAQEQIQFKNAGITPDSIFYNLDRALENLQLRFNSRIQERINLQLLFLDERIQEIKQMVGEENEDALKIVINEKNKIMNNLELESEVENG